MKVVSTNLAKPYYVNWRGKHVPTGIYKIPTEKPIRLGVLKVEHDFIAEHKVHGGVDMACYLYSLHHYDYWKALYPDLSWNYGMFGENLTIDQFDEREIFIGDRFSIGEAVIQVQQPRIPCYKLGIKFGDQKMVKQFANYPSCGIYVSVVKEGEVKTEDQLQKIHSEPHSLSIDDIYNMSLGRIHDKNLIMKAINLDGLPASCKTTLKKML